MLYIGVMAKAPISVIVLVWLISALANAQEAAPSLELHDLKGAPHKLEDYRGKPVVLNFWATWCVPCAAEMPMLSEMQKRYQDRVLFIAASIDDEDMRPQIEAFIRKHQGSVLTVMVGATLDSLEDFGVNQGMPGTVFIDADGNIVDRLSGALKRSDLQKRLRQLTGEPEPEPTPAPVPKAAKKKPTKSPRQKLVPAAQESFRLTF
ncbi:MAG: Redoxin domain protein [Candidatus Angelobacter sp.]|nr:Redoxin domain protein [Candidatus Angelobacter sp.]